MEKRLKEIQPDLDEILLNAYKIKNATKFLKIVYNM